MKASMLLVLSVLSCATASARLLPQEMRLAPRPDMNSCACSDPALCRPVQTQHDSEVFGFGGNGNWSRFDWETITTIAWASDPQLVCTAHAHQARVIAAAPGGMPLSSDKAVRTAWIASTIQMVQTQNLDGITFDYESPLNASDPANQYYVALVNETTIAMHAAIPGSQVSVCVAWSPDDIDGRAYDNAGLAAASDLLYVMVYDTQSQIFDRCIASANSPAGRFERSILRYTDLGIPKSKLVMGIPWYGYDYPCTSEMKSPTASYCPIAEVPFRGVNCSDAAGRELPFSAIMQHLANGTTPRQYDQSTQSPYFNYQAADGIHQIWYDDPESLAVKYAAAKAAGVRGVGPYRYDQLDYSEPANPQTEAMWRAIRAFRN